MKRREKNRWFAALLTCMLLLQLIMPGVLSASELDRMPAIDAANPLSLCMNLFYTEEDGTETPIQGVQMELFRVADLECRGGSAEYTLTPAFAGTGVSFEGIDASQSCEIARTLEACAEADGLSGMTGVSGADGRVLYSITEPGMYLVRQIVTENDEYTKIDPVVISVPMAEKSENGNTWLYDVQAYPKSEYIRNPMEGGARIDLTKNLKGYDEDLNLMDVTAEDATYYFGLFLDGSGMKPFGEDYVREVHIAGASSGTCSWENLPKGSYYVFELDADLNVLLPYTPIDDMYSYEFETSQKVVLDPAAGENQGEVVVNNIYVKFPDGYRQMANLDITKYVLTPDGEEAIVDDTFYAGIYRKTGDEYVLETTVELISNGTVTVALPLSEEDGISPVEYWVFEVADLNGTPLDRETFGYLVEDGMNVTLTMDTIGEAIITNSIVEEITETPTPTPEASETPAPEATVVPGEATPTPAQSNIWGVRTGDDSNILLYAVLAAAALAAVGTVFAVKHRGTK